jgi:hypothetical protein
LVYPPTKDLSVPTPPKFSLVFFLLCYPLFPLVSGSCNSPLRLLPSNDAIHQKHRNTPTLKFTLLAMLSYVAVVVATPFGDRAPAEAIDHRQAQLYVPLTTARGSSDQIENISPAHQIALPIVEMGTIRSSAL